MNLDGVIFLIMTAFIVLLPMLIDAAQNSSPHRRKDDGHRPPGRPRQRGQRGEPSRRRGRPSKRVSDFSDNDMVKGLHLDNVASHPSNKPPLGRTADVDLNRVWNKEDNSLIIQDASSVQLRALQKAKISNCLKVELFDQAKGSCTTCGLVLGFNKTSTELLSDSKARFYNASIGKLRSSTSAEFFQQSRGELYDSAIAVAHDEATLVGKDDSFVTLKDSSKGTAYDKARIESFDSSVVVAFGNSIIHAFNQSIVHASDSAKVFLHDSAKAYVDSDAVVVEQLSNETEIIAIASPSSFIEAPDDDERQAEGDVDLEGSNGGHIEDAVAVDVTDEDDSMTAGPSRSDVWRASHFLSCSIVLTAALLF